MPKRLLSPAVLALLLASAATADDKDLLRVGNAPPNVLIVFGNSQTTEQPIQGSSSAWDGDGDSTVSKMGAAKSVLRQFIAQNHSSFNIGMTTFSHNPNAGSITIHGKHWLYSPLTEDYPHESWKEPVGTIERWGLKGEGPCFGTGTTTPACAQRLQGTTDPYVHLPSGVVGAVGPFFGLQGASPAFIYLDGTVDSKGNPKNATKRVRVTLGTTPACSGKCKYGDAFTDGSRSTYTLGDHSMEVTKVYEEFSAGTWSEPTSRKTPLGDNSTVTISYIPSPTLTADLFYTTKPGDITTPCVSTDTDCGKEIGFLNDPQVDIDVNANCSGWEFQSNSNPQPLIKIPHDYKWGPTCLPPQDSLPCANRLLRPQAKLVAYDQTFGTFTTTDPDNPGYTGAGSKYADGCNSTLMGAVDIGLDIPENQAIMITRNGSQAPIKNLLVNIRDYFNKPAIDGFQNGVRLDDPNITCRVSAVILIYDNFNGCQNDSCKALQTAALTDLKKMNVKVFVIGFGKGVGPCVDDTCAGFCIAEQTGAVQFDGGPVGYFAVSDAAGLFQVLNDIANILDQASQTFATAAVSTSQASGGQMAFFASFSAAKDRSIWNGRLGGYKLLNGSVQLADYTVRDQYDPANLITLQVPSNANGSLIWNAGANLLQTNGTGATVSSDILAPGDAMQPAGTYTDTSNDVPNPNAPTHFYRGRKVVFSLPQTLPPSFPNPASVLPIPAADNVPENRYDMTFTTGASWWPALKALLGPQDPLQAPKVLDPPLADADAGNSLRFIWGDRDAVTGATFPSKMYSTGTCIGGLTPGAACVTNATCGGGTCGNYHGQKLGDIMHSTPLLVGNPADFALFKTDVNSYQSFFNKYKNRRRVLYVGADDGLLHAFDAGAVGRPPAAATEYDDGTGAELFAFAPRSIMQIFKPLKDAVGPQTKKDEWTVDLSPSAADVFIDPEHTGTPTPSDRQWRTVLVGGVREGSPFEGTDGVAPKNSQGSYYALDVTQPDEIVSGLESAGSTAAPKCLNKSGDSSCSADWPTVLWEITDTTDLDAPGTKGAGIPDMGETWSKAAMGRVKVCTFNCDDPSSRVTVDRYVAIFGGGFDRERKKDPNLNLLPTNQRGNWLYMVDIETGKTLYKVNSSCGVNTGSGSCTPFGSIPSEPAALDFDDDGYIDLIYVGDLLGQLWRVELTDLRMLSSPPGGRFNNQLDLTPVDAQKPNAQGRPFLFFKAGPASLPASPASAIYPIHFRPEAISLGYNTGGRPALGLAFGTGDRDDIRATLDPSTIDPTTPDYKERFYYVVDKANQTTLTEADLFRIASPTAAGTGTCAGGTNAGQQCSVDVNCPGSTCNLPNPPAKGWFLELIHGERVVGDALGVGGVLRWPAYNPLSSTPSGDPCGNTSKCLATAGTSRLYQVYFNTGNAYLGAADRGETQPYALFITAETSYLSGGSDAHGIYWSGGAKNPTLGVGRKITVRSWKEKTSRP